MDISIEIAVMLVVLAIAGGFVDTIAGGGGLITIPALAFQWSNTGSGLGNE